MTDEIMSLRGLVEEAPTPTFCARYVNQSAGVPNADRRRNLLMGFTLAGSTFGAYSHLGAPQVYKLRQTEAINTPPSGYRVDAV